MKVTKSCPTHFIYGVKYSCVFVAQIQKKTNSTNKLRENDRLPTYFKNSEIVYNFLHKNKLPKYRHRRFSYF